MAVKKIWHVLKRLTRGTFPGKTDLPGRKISPVYKAPVFLLVLLLLFGAACSPGLPASPEAPIEPVVTGLENTAEDMLLRGRFSVVDPEMKIFALDVSQAGDDILFSSDARSVHMLDDQGRLKWEVVFDGLPVAAELAGNGSGIAVGTDCGQVYFLYRGGQISWEKSFTGAVEKIALSPDGKFLVVSVKNEDGGHKLYGLDRWGTLLWERETGPLLQLHFSADSKKEFFLQENTEGNTFIAAKNGEILWEKKALAAGVSEGGDFAAVYSDHELYFYSLRGKETAPHLLWNRPLSAEISVLKLTDTGEVLAYSAFPGSGSNLFVFRREGDLFWEKKIPGGSLLQASRFGDRIVASSWQEYSEDFSKLLVLNKNGDTLQEMEMASRIEKISLSGDGSILALAGNEGNIFIMDMPTSGLPLETEPPESDLPEPAKELYRPAAFTKTDEGQYITLYFYDEYAMQLVPVNRSIKSTAAVLQAAVSELVKGPCRLSGLTRTIPKDAHIKVTLQDSMAIIDLPEELNRLGGYKQTRGIIDSLILTVSQFSSVKGIRFLVGGKEARVFGIEGVIIDDVFPARSPVKNRTMLYLPYRSGERYFLLPREAIQLGNKYSTAEDLLKILLQESRRFLTVVPEIKDIKITKEEVILDWDRSFKKLFPPEGGLSEKARATLFMDAVLLTLGSNCPQARFVLYVEGEPWEPPPDYPSTILEFSFPFYINPE